MAGMEVMWATVQSQLQGRGDAVVCCLHWNLVANGFKCIGRGENVPQTADAVVRSELLPAGWNTDQNIYTLMYLPNQSSNTHLLKVVKMDNSLLVHVMRTSDEKVADMTINIKDYTTEDLSSFDSAYKDLEALQQRFKKDIVLTLTPETATASSTSQNQQQRHQPRFDDDPLRIGRPMRGGQPVPDWDQRGSPFGVGRGDLDPLAQGRGGGMYMDPSRFPGMFPDHHSGLPGRLPPGAVPPGARFDPFGPPDPGRNPGGAPRPGPDPDHLPPPGYGDMFM